MRSLSLACREPQKVRFNRLHVKPRAGPTIHMPLQISCRLSVAMGLPKNSPTEAPHHLDMGPRGGPVFQLPLHMLLQALPRLQLRVLVDLQGEVVCLCQ